MVNKFGNLEIIELPQNLFPATVTPLRVGRYVFRPIFNRGFEHAAVVNAERNYDVQIAWVQNWGSKVTNLTTGNRVLFYTTLYLFAIFSELYYQKGFECGL